jgi:uncharacterized membrane protein (DUF106 family)
MKANIRLFLAIILQTGVSFIIAALFVIFYFRIYPNLFSFVFPAAFILGILVGALFYIPTKYFLEKNKEKEK